MAAPRPPPLSIAAQRGPFQGRTRSPSPPMRRPGPPDEDPDATVVRPGRRPAPPGLALRTDERTEVRTEERTVVRPAPIVPTPPAATPSAP